MMLSVVAAPGHGSLTGPDMTGAFRYTAPSGYLGADPLTLRASDGTSHSDTDVSIEVVAAVDDPPACSVSLGPSFPWPEERIEVEAGDVLQGNVWCSDDTPS